MSSLDQLLLFAIGCTPRKVDSDQRDHKIELNTEVRIQSLRDTKSIPPDLLDFVSKLDLPAEKASVLETIETIYSYISSVTKRSIALTDIKNAKIQFADDSSFYDLSSILKNARDFVTLLNKIKREEKMKSKLDPEIQESLDAELNIKDLNENIVKLRMTILRNLKEAESLLASKGIKSK